MVMKLGVTVEELVAKYPRLYHMAERGSWPSIESYGLLSTSGLLDLFEVPKKDRFAIEESRRPKPVIIKHPKLGRAVIRDQKALSESKLESSLKDCDVRTWYLELNKRVFFWLDVERLKTFMSAREYRGKLHTVLTLDTEILVRDYEHKITLSPLNTGATRPMAFPRGLASFKRLNEYPFEERIDRGSYGCVVELAVLGGVMNIVNYAKRVVHARCENGTIKVDETLFAA
jgi:hypothetical protein